MSQVERKLTACRASGGDRSSKGVMPASAAGGAEASDFGHGIKATAASGRI